MHRVVRAVAGGVAGQAVLTIVLIFGEAQLRFQLQIPGAIARYVGFPGNVYLGALVFLGAGVIAWPLVFVAIDPYLRRFPGGDDAAVRGMALATALWVAFVALGTGSLSGFLLLWYLVFTLLAHLGYGFTLGALYEQLADDGRDEDSTGAGSPG